MLRKHDDGAGKHIQTHHKHSAIMPSGGIQCAEKPVPSRVKARFIVRKRLCNTAERAFPHHGKARSVKRRMTLGRVLSTQPSGGQHIAKKLKNTRYNVRKSIRCGETRAFTALF